MGIGTHAEARETRLEMARYGSVVNVLKYLHHHPPDSAPCVESLAYFVRNRSSSCHKIVNRQTNSVVGLATPNCFEAT